jgi:hypothetical protein
VTTRKTIIGSRLRAAGAQFCALSFPLSPSSPLSLFRFSPSPVTSDLLSNRHPDLMFYMVICPAAIDRAGTSRRANNSG